jgi:hypothetical protein
LSAFLKIVFTLFLVRVFVFDFWSSFHLPIVHTRFFLRINDASSAVIPGAPDWPWPSRMEHSVWWLGCIYCRNCYTWSSFHFLYWARFPSWCCRTVHSWLYNLLCHTGAM